MVRLPVDLVLAGCTCTAGHGVPMGGGSSSGGGGGGSGGGGSSSGDGGGGTDAYKQRANTPGETRGPWVCAPKRPP
jgi:hypothetical protein